MQPSSHRLSPAERKDLGAFYTPSVITNFIAAWSICRHEDLVLDPGCGDAAFLLSAAKRLAALKADADLSGQLFGIDLNEDALDTARETLLKAGMPAPCLLHGNFFAFAIDNLFQSHVPSFDAVLGNPPYVRYQLFHSDSRAAGLRAAARAGVILPQLTSSWAPYLIHASTFLKPGGRLAMVLPGELLHVGYAAAVRSFLLNNFFDLTILAFEEKVFPGALEEVVIVLGRKGSGDYKLRVRQLQALDDLRDGPEEVLRKTRTCAVKPGQRWLTALFEEHAITESLDLIKCAKFHPLGELGRVDIGVVTGANEYFVLSKSTVAEHDLPDEILIPAVSKATHVKGTKFTIGDWEAQHTSDSPAYLLLVDESSAHGSVLRYIEKGEEAGVPNRYKCRVREPWYRVPYVRKPDLFLTYMNHIAPRLVVNEARATHTNTIHGVFLSDPLLSEPLSAAFLNSATLLSAEVEGRSYGGGVLKIEPGEAVRILVPRLTQNLKSRLCVALPKLDRLIRNGQIDEASLIVDQITLGKSFRRSEIEKIRSILSALRARRLARGKTSRQQRGLLAQAGT